MDLADLDMEFDWGQVDILCNVNPSFLNNPGYDNPQQVNVPSVLESIGTEVATPNQPQNNTEYTFDFPGEATSSFSGNVNPSQFVVDDPYQLPQLPQNSLAPSLLDETQSGYYVPSMEELIPEGAGSSVQGQREMGLMAIYNQLSRMQQNNNLPMMNDMGQQNELNANNQILLPADILANQNFNGMISNQQPPTYPGIFQQNPVETGAGNNTTTNEHFMTDQTPFFSGLDNHAINPHSGWNSSPGSFWMQNQGNEYNPLMEYNPGFQQQSSTFNDPSAALNSGFVATSSTLNSAMLGLSGSSPSEGSNSQMFNMEAPQMASLLRPENAPGVPLQQVPPLSNNSVMNTTITPLGAENGLPISPPSFGAQAQPPSSRPNLNALNQNRRSTTVTYGTYASLLQNSSLNVPYERREGPRRGRPRKHFDPSSLPVPFKRRKPKGSSSSAKEKAGKASASQTNNAAGAAKAGKASASQTNNAAGAAKAGKASASQTNNAAGAAKAGKASTSQTNNDAAAAAAPPREAVEAPMYSVAFEKSGVPRDPLIRLFKLTSDQKRAADPATSK